MLFLKNLYFVKKIQIGIEKMNKVRYYRKSIYGRVDDGLGLIISLRKNIAGSNPAGCIY